MEQLRLLQGNQTSIKENDSVKLWLEITTPMTTINSFHHPLLKQVFWLPLTCVDFKFTYVNGLIFFSQKMVLCSNLTLDNITEKKNNSIIIMKLEKTESKKAGTGGIWKTYSDSEPKSGKQICLLFRFL